MVRILLLLISSYLLVAKGLRTEGKKSIYYFLASLVLLLVAVLIDF